MPIGPRARERPAVVEAGENFLLFRVVMHTFQTSHCLLLEVIEKDRPYKEVRSFDPRLNTFATLSNGRLLGGESYSRK